MIRQAIAGSPAVGWIMVLLAALAQNCALGLSFGSYGTLIGAMEVRYETSRALASSGLGGMILSMSLCSPIVGALLQKYSLRSIMVLGALLSAGGYALLPLVDNVELMLAVYVGIIGPGACFLGIVPAATLVSNWFVRDRGKALGVINMPLLLFVMPPIFGHLLGKVGMNGIFLVVAMMFLAVALVVAMVIDKPEQVGRTPHGAQHDAGTNDGRAAQSLTRGELMGLSKFWLLGIGVGILNSGSTMMVTHFVPFGTGRGYAIEDAALLVSAFGGAGVIGALVFGWIVDRIGAVNTLILNALAQAVLWFGLYPDMGFPVLLVLAATFGMCAGAIVAIHGAAVNELFGQPSFSQAMGLSYLLKLPFIVGAAPLAGWLFDRSGSYTPSITLHIAAFGLSALIFWQLRSSARPQGALCQTAEQAAPIERSAS